VGYTHTYLWASWNWGIALPNRVSLTGEIIGQGGIAESAIADNRLGREATIMTTTYPTTEDPAYAGTSAVQHVEPDSASVTKDDEQPQADARAITDTNATSIYWGMQSVTTRGFRTLNFSFPGKVKHDSQVCVSMTELDGNGRPFTGLAAMQVHNVVPFDGSVNVTHNVGWDSPIRVRFNFIIVN